MTFSTLDKPAAETAPLDPCPEWCTGEHGTVAGIADPLARYYHKAARCPSWCTGHSTREGKPRRRGGHGAHHAEPDLRHQIIGQIWDALSSESATVQRTVLLGTWTEAQIREVYAEIADAIASVVGFADGDPSPRAS